MRTIRGYWWLYRNYGLRRTVLYRRARRENSQLDWNELGPDVVAKIGEHFDPAPWERD